MARRDHRRLGIGLVVLAVCVVPALVWWLG